jgi:hypothetical protein
MFTYVVRWGKYCRIMGVRISSQAAFGRRPLIEKHDKFVARRFTNYFVKLLKIFAKSHG